MLFFELEHADDAFLDLCADLSLSSLSKHAISFFHDLAVDLSSNIVHNELSIIAVFLDFILK